MQVYYCQDNLPAGELCHLALKTVEVTQTFVQTLFAHIDDKINMLTEWVSVTRRSCFWSRIRSLRFMMIALSLVYDDCFEFSQLTTNVDSRNKPATAIRCEWVALQCCIKQLEYLQAHIKQHLSVMNLFLCFLMCATAESSTT